MISVNERTTLVLLLSFLDEDSVPVVPAKAYYRVDDVLTEAEIVPSTEITGLAATKEVEITSAQNSILSDVAYEERIVTVEFTYGASRRGTEEYRFRVKNLYGVGDSGVTSVSPSPSA